MMNPDLIQKLPKLNYCEQGNKIFVKPGVYPLSSRKLEGFMNCKSSEILSMQSCKIYK